MGRVRDGEEETGEGVEVKKRCHVRRMLGKLVG